MPRVYLACPITEVPQGVRHLEQEGFSTVVRLPLKNDDARRSVRGQIKELTGGDPPVQLFLPQIACLNVVNFTGEPLELRGRPGLSARQATSGCSM